MTARIRAVRTLMERLRLDGILLSGRPATAWLSRKDAEELQAIRTAAGIADAVYAEILPLIRPGMVESILAAEIEYRMRRHGAQGAAFPTIVASGPNAALPHAEASDRAFMPGDAILMDFGAQPDGYCSDMTRTVFLGEPPEVLRTI